MSKQRHKSLNQLQKNCEFDAVVVGGGVNGIGVYRDLSMQNLRVLLVERNDFASGCSAAPSRMIHGGLRYLENGEFGLVKESLRERDALLLNAPHLVGALPTMIPITSIFSGLFNSTASFFGFQGKPSSRGVVPIKLGLLLYDWVTRKRRMLPTHKLNNIVETSSQWPKLTKKAKRSAVYYDAWVSHPERLCMEMIKDIDTLGADNVALNYAQLYSEKGVLSLVDHLSSKTYSITAKAIIYSTGAWLDDTIATLGSPLSERLVSGTKGSHLIINNKELYASLSGHMIYFENVDGRVCVAFPYLGNVLAGSTDIRVERPRRVRCEPEELNYILSSLKQVFPEITLSSEDIVFSYSGIRPLPRSDQQFTGRISRGHSILRLEGSIPQFCMIGGKWTTFRAFAEQTADKVLTTLGRSRITSTISTPIGGGSKFPSSCEELENQLVDRFDVNANRAKHMVDHYGNKAEDILALGIQGENAIRHKNLEYPESEIRWILRNEFVETLSDLVLRRTSFAITGKLSMSTITWLADIVADELGLSAQEKTEQRENLICELEEFHGVTPETLQHRNKLWST